MPEEQDQIKTQKLIAYYTAAVQAWFTTRTELDKSLVNLSGGGIALLATLLSTKGIHNWRDIVFYLLAVSSFLITIICVMFIYHFNANYLRNIIWNHKNDDNTLQFFDYTARTFFIFGILFSMVVAFSVAFVKS